jgi:hypothetical protein
MSCKIPTGDRGQRFEVRYHKAISTEVTPGVYSVSAGEEAVFGWAKDMHGARELRDGVQLAPWCFDAWIVDRKALTVAQLARQLQELPEQGALVVVASSDDVDPFDNVINVGRLPDGRIILD